MTDIVLIIFTLTLLYIGIANRLRAYINILAMQGFLLFLLAFLQLTEINTLNLIFILLETIVFKTIAVPLFLNYIFEKNNINRETEPFVPYFVSLLIITALIVGSFLLVQRTGEINSHKISFMVAISTMFTGLYIIITRKKIITHVMGYMIIENGVFVLSLASGGEMPMLINAGITLDIFVSVMVLGMFVNRIGNTFEEMDVDNLTTLKD